MSNASKNKNNQLVDEQRNKANTQYDTVLGDAQNRSTSAYQSSLGARGGLQDKYDQTYQTGGFQPGDFDSFDANMSSDTGGGGGGTIGPFDESRFNDALKGYGDFASGGGGVDADSIRARSNRAIPQFYNNLKQEAATRRMVNPYAPSYDAESRAMSRDAGQKTQENIRDTELGISDLVSKNRQFGISGLGSLQTNIAGMKSSQDIANAQLNESAAGRRDSATARRESLGLQKAGMLQSGRMGGLAGLQGLYDADRSDSKDYLNTQFGGIGDQNQGASSSIQNRQATTPWWQTAGKVAGTAAAAYFTGGGSLALQAAMKAKNSKAIKASAGGGYAGGAGSEGMRY